MNILEWLEEKQKRADENSRIADLIHHETGSPVVSRDLFNDFKQGNTSRQVTTKRLRLIKKYRYLGAVLTGVYFATKKGK